MPDPDQEETKQPDQIGGWAGIIVALSRVRRTDLAFAGLAVFVGSLAYTHQPQLVTLISNYPVAALSFIGSALIVLSIIWLFNALTIRSDRAQSRLIALLEEEKREAQKAYKDCRGECKQEMLQKVEVIEQIVRRIEAGK